MTEQRLRDAWARENHEIEQILGKALGYPPSYPDVSEVDDGQVCTGEHTSVTLAMEAAREIERLRATVVALKAAAQPFVAYANIVADHVNSGNPIDDACPGKDGDFCRNAKPVPTVGHCRKLREVLKA